MGALETDNKATGSTFFGRVFAGISSVNDGLVTESFTGPLLTLMVPLVLLAFFLPLTSSKWSK